MSTSKKPTPRRAAGKRTKKKGSGYPYGKFSGMVVASAVPAADGSTKVFSAVTAAQQLGGANSGAATEGDIFRLITNDSTTVAMFLGQTAGDAALGKYRLAPGKDFVLLGPSGVGWKGDLYVKGDGAATLSVMSF